ncbi:MAG: hypothetical protein LH471_05700 [Salinibacterium sp.]|nr:hypothetical protein [Salinibacterium sp.]
MPANRQSLLLERAAGAAFWVVYGLWSLSRVPTKWWRWRDDAVITLSHARGLAEFGYPAVSASAERVEGASSPLQMLVAAVFYRLGGDGWHAVLDVQVVLGLAVSGWLVATIVRRSAPEAPASAVVGATAVVAMVGFTTWPALGWFGSGMENSILIPALLAVLVASITLLTDDTSRGWAMGIAVGVAGVVRVEMAVLLVPALVVVGVMLWHQRRGAALGTAARAGVGIAVLWGGVNIWRFITFGSVVPNSAVAQDKNSVDLLHTIPLLIVGAVALAVMCNWLRPVVRSAASISMVLLGAAATAVVWNDERSVSYFGVTRSLLLGILGLLIVVAVGWIAGFGKPQVWVPLLAVAAIPIAQQLLLGPARLDSVRIGAQSLPLLAVGVGIVVAIAASRAAAIVASNSENVVRTDAGSEGMGLRPSSLLWGAALFAGVMFGVAAVSESSAAAKPANLCCGITWYDDVLTESARQSTLMGLPRAIVATPDLGKMSFDKSVVVVDLGALGDPLITYIDGQGADLTRRYLTDVQPPDLIEVHGSWACGTLREWIRSDEFIARYELVRLNPRDGPIAGCHLDGQFQFYGRSPSDPGYAAEAELAGALATTPSDAVSLVAVAGRDCAVLAQTSDDVWACQWVRRALQRAAPELRAAGAMSVAIAEFDRLVLTTPPRWGERAATLVLRSFDEMGG